MSTFNEFLGEKVFTLSEVAASIKKTLNNRYSSFFWVRAEMLKLNYYPYSGHAFPDLIEKKDESISTQMRAVIWKADLKRIREKFIACSLGDLCDGITVLCRVCIMFDEFYGLSLRISDIDTNYTLGELEKAKRSCIERLTKEGRFNLNKRLTLPSLPQSIAVISVESSKGYHDFLNVINAHAPKFKLFHHLFPSLLQGEGAIADMLDIFDKINITSDLFDAVLIIRGGGGDAGLNCYNDYRLCRAISLCPLPVLTGIGHATNLTVAEQIAMHNGITPTDLADYIISFYKQAEQNLKEATQLLISETHKRVEAEKDMSNDIQLLATRTRNRIGAEKEKIHMNEKYLKLLHPALMLQKGYTLTYHNDKLLTGKPDLKSGEKIKTVFFDGEITSVIP